MAQEAKTQNGIGFFGILTIVFIVLKLTHFITWSWPWVLAPVWMPFVLICLFLFLICLFLFIVLLIGFVSNMFRK